MPACEMSDHIVFPHAKMLVPSLVCSGEEAGYHLANGSILSASHFLAPCVPTCWKGFRWLVQCQEEDRLVASANPVSFALFELTSSFHLVQDTSTHCNCPKIKLDPFTNQLCTNLYLEFVERDGIWIHLIAMQEFCKLCISQRRVRGCVCTCACVCKFVRAYVCVCLW